MGTQLRLRGRIAAVVMAGAVIVAAGVALLLANTVGLRSSSDATVRSDAYLVAVIGVEQLVVDAETGLRGYVITRRQLFLQPTTVAQGRLPAATAGLERAAASNHAFIQQAQALIAASRTYMTATFRACWRWWRTTGPPPAPTLTLAGKNDVDRIRTRALALERLVTARQAARQRSPRLRRPLDSGRRRARCGQGAGRPARGLGRHLAANDRAGAGRGRQHRGLHRGDHRPGARIQDRITGRDAGTTSRRTRAPSRLASVLENYGERHSGRRRDDVAIIALRFTGGGAESDGPGPLPGERVAPGVHAAASEGAA
jgi:CHASE3 domain